MMRRILRWLGPALAVLGLAYLVAFGARHASDLPAISWNAGRVAGLASAVGLYMLTLFSGAWAWHVLLRALGERQRYPEALGILAVSQAAKYLPGNVGQYVGRVALARESGLAAAPVLLTLVLETACAILAGLAMVAMTAAGLPGVPGAPMAPWRIAAATIGAAGSLAAAVVLLRRESVRRRLRLPDPPPGGPAAQLGAGLASLGLYGFNFLVLGVCAAVASRTVLEAPAVPLPALTGLFAAAWVAGFVTPGAPAGLGVREAVLVGGLQPLFGSRPDIAFGLPILFRLVSTAGDGVGFGLGWLLRRRTHG